MKSVLLMTGWCGVDYARMSAHTLPLMDAYATKHGMELACVNLDGKHAPSWMKLPYIGSALRDFEAVLWIDADIVIVDSSKSILDDIEPGCVQALVRHDTECGDVPNCGMWYCTKALYPWLEQAYNSLLPTYADHPWWEQAAILSLMGYSVTPAPYAELSEPTELYERTCFLPAEWNHHPRDGRRSPHPRFVHVTQYEDRVGKVAELAAFARGAAA